MANNGEAASYYNNDPELGHSNGGRAAPPQQYYPPPGQDKQQQQQYQPNMPQNNLDTNSKQDYDQMFAIQGPKYRDIWAGLLVSAIMLDPPYCP